MTRFTERDFPGAFEIVAAIVPLVSLVSLVILAVSVFGGDVCGGASQISLLLATAIAAVMARTVGGRHHIGSLFRRQAFASFGYDDPCEFVNRGGALLACPLHALDCLANMGSTVGSSRPGRNVEDNYEPFIRNLRAKRPGVPIVMAEQCDVYCKGQSAKDRYARALYEKLIVGRVRKNML